MAENRTIGLEGAMPWSMKSDLRWFKSVTTGKPVIMGRKTFDSIGRPLPNRTNIIITRRDDYAADGILVSHSLEEALVRAFECASSNGREEVCVVGGGEIYREALKRADRIYLTTIEARIDGDTFFPALEEDEWAITSAGQIEQSEKDQFPARIEIWDRLSSH